MKFILAALLMLLPTISLADEFLRTIGDFTLTTITGEEITLSNHTEELVLFIFKVMVALSQDWAVMIIKK